MEKDKHSFIGASSAHRWINCPGSVRLYKQLTERKSSIYADTGTLAHELAEASLLTRDDPSIAVGTTATINGNEIEITEDMAKSVKVYVDKVLDDHATFGGELKIEQSFDLGWLYEGMYGRNDSCIVPNKKFDVLRVYDYKNGTKRVDAKLNSQMMYYAIGALGEHNLMLAERALLTIVQPNAWGKDPIDEWEVSVSELYDWGHYVLKPAALRTAEPDAPCKTGDWCAFCDAAHLCPARMEEALAKLDNNLAELPDVKTITPEQLGRVSSFFNSDMFKDWLKAITAEEQSLLARGVNIPGRKIIEVESLGNRKWASNEDVVAALKEYGDEIWDMKLKSPAQMEKFLTSMGVKKSERERMFAPLVTREQTIKSIVVDETDERIGITERNNKAIDMFN